jgi:hypothetical protein
MTSARQPVAVMRIPGMMVMVALAGLAGCRSIPADNGRRDPGEAGRPVMTNAEYETEQLRALGAVGEGRPPVVPPPSVRTAPDLVRDETTRPIRMELRPVPRSPAPAGALSPTVAGHPAPVRSGPVQKVGSTYLGPGGATSRRVGSIMLNSDGNTGQLIGNTIINH